MLSKNDQRNLNTTNLDLSEGSKIFANQILYYRICACDRLLSSTGKMNW